MLLSVQPRLNFFEIWLGTYNGNDIIAVDSLLSILLCWNCHKNSQIQLFLNDTSQCLSPANVNHSRCNLFRLTVELGKCTENRRLFLSGETWEAELEIIPDGKNIVALRKLLVESGFTHSEIVWRRLNNSWYVAHVVVLATSTVSVIKSKRGFFWKHSSSTSIVQHKTSDRWPAT